MWQAVSGQSGGRSEFLKGRSRREAGRESEFAAANPQKQVPIIPPSIGSTTGVLAFTRLAQRSLTLQPGNLLISLVLTLSIGFNISITLHTATQARRLLAVTAAGLPSPL